MTVLNRIAYHKVNIWTFLDMVQRASIVFPLVNGRGKNTHTNTQVYEQIKEFPIPAARLKCSGKLVNRKIWRNLRDGSLFRGQLAKKTLFLDMTIFEVTIAFCLIRGYTNRQTDRYKSNYRNHYLRARHTDSIFHSVSNTSEFLVQKCGHHVSYEIHISDRKTGRAILNNFVLAIQLAS